MPDLHPQEVLVKVQVTQRSNAELSGKPSPWQQQQQQQFPASAHAKGLQEQVPLAPKPRPSQQDASPKGAGSRDAAAIACAELQGLLSQGAHPIDPGSAVQHRSSCSNTRRSSASPSQEHKQHVVPLLDLSRAQLGTKGPAAVKGVPEPQPLTRTQAERDDELCLDISSRRSITLNPNAPMQDNRCYHYKAMGSKVSAGAQGRSRQGYDAICSVRLSARANCTTHMPKVLAGHLAQHFHRDCLRLNVHGCLLPACDCRTTLLCRRCWTVCRSQMRSRCRASGTPC